MLVDILRRTLRHLRPPSAACCAAAARSWEGLPVRSLQRSSPTWQHCARHQPYNHSMRLAVSAARALGAAAAWTAAAAAAVVHALEGCLRAQGWGRRVCMHRGVRPASSHLAALHIRSSSRHSHRSSLRSRLRRAAGPPLDAAELAHPSAEAAAAAAAAALTVLVALLEMGAVHRAGLWIPGPWGLALGKARGSGRVQEGRVARRRRIAGMQICLSPFLRDAAGAHGPDWALGARLRQLVAELNLPRPVPELQSQVVAAQEAEEEEDEELQE